VSAAKRGKGIGKLLLSPLIRVAKEKNMHAIVAGGRWLDLKFLELLLDTPGYPNET
jgi:L-amino acid N-acyltransferase YncA